MTKPICKKKKKWQVKVFLTFYFILFFNDLFSRLLIFKYVITYQSSLQTSSGTHIWSIAKGGGVGEIGSMYCSTVSCKRSGQKWSMVIISGVELPNPHFPAFIAYQVIYTAMWMIHFLPPTPLFPHRWSITILLRLYCYFHGKYSYKL